MVSGKGQDQGRFFLACVAHRLGELAEFKHEDEKKRCCESEAARLAEIVVAVVLEGCGDGDEQHVNQRDEKGYHKLLDGAHHDK